MPRPFFHKLIFSSTIQEKRLVISLPPLHLLLPPRVPDKFVSKFKDELSVAVALTVPDGHVWRVELRKADNNKIWFQDGWQEFVDRYSIRIGYLLIFRYEGNSAFSVYIYNLSHSEINYHSTGLMDSAHNHFKRARLFEDLEDEDVEVVHPSPLYPSQHPETTAHANKGHTSSAIQSFFAEPPVKAEETTPTPKVPKKRGRKKKNADPEEINSSAPRDDDPENRSKFYESASARKRTVTAEERERAINAAKTFEPTNPFFRVVLRPSYLYRGCIMYLPSGFAEKYLSGISGFIKVQLGEKQWPTTPTPKVPKKRGRKKKNADPEEINSSAPRDDDPENRSKFYESASARKRTVTAEERERAINAAKTFEPTNPFFRVVLRPSYLYRGCIMYLPSGFAEKYLSGISGFIKVQLGEKQWPVRCLYKAGRAKFSQGWYEFTLENNLGEGDVCVFELLRTRDFVLKVTAFRVNDLVQEGQELFRSMRTRFGATQVIQRYGCIVDLLGKVGRLQEAYEFCIRYEPMIIKPDAILLISLCNACSIYGDTVMGASRDGRRAEETWF
ncbi:hypothetical protein DY000_02042410 [Brassica cretica]|uniref:TF-B3 domain-containing protein n=1 Tax=Brassica cretica TaxID=69181 RepID=A0ABQ7BKC7_BRACR|nr:hypothetical protein DY000_02042410 [Brassica cretica]